MHKKVLVCLPLSDAHRAALEASVPEFEFRFNALDDVHAEDVLWADVVLGNAPVSMISQNKHIEWFQSNSAGPDPYLKPGVLPEDCVVTNATGAYGLAIMIVEDDPDIRDGVRILLSGEGYRILEAENGPRALSLLTPEVDLVILDIMMPGMSGLRVCEEIRKISTVPILFLTAKSQESDKLLGLTAGGDDYLAKPFSFAELSARVKALLRRYCVYQGKDQAGPRQPKPDDQMLELHGVRIALDCNRVWVDEQEADLTETEYKILKLLMQSPQRIFPVQVIYETVWGEPYFYVSNGTVMVHIRNLRMKVEQTPQTPQRICTVWGKGYRFAAQEDSNGNA